MPMLAGSARAQGLKPQGSDIRFADFLLNQRQYDDAELLLSSLDTGSFSRARMDTLHYYLGWAYYNQKKLNLSREQLLQVSPSSKYFLKSRFFGAYDLSYLGKQDAAVRVLRDTRVPDTFLAKAANLELAGIALLQQDYGTFDRYRKKFRYDFYPTAEQEKSLLEDELRLQQIPHRSPWIAGILSALVPGSGKAYAGKPMQALGAFLPIAGLGLVSWENYHKKGFHDPFLYVFATAFTVFYIGDIWGSALSVKIIRQEHEKLLDQQILLDMHIPLRTLFN